MKTKNYSSDLTDEEYAILEPLFEIKKVTKPQKRPMKLILDGIFYQLKNGCAWHDLPKNFPPKSTVFYYYSKWRKEGILDKVMHVLHGIVRKQMGKKPRWTQLILADSQAVKNTCTAGKESKGFCGYKATNGIKRHLAVDTLGFPFFLHCTKASVSDDNGLIEMFIHNIDYFKSRPWHLPKVTVLLDNGYHPENLEKELIKVYPHIMSKVEFKLSPKPSKEDKEKKGKSGFVPVAWRWIVERSNAWVERCRSLTKNCERTLENAESKLCLCFIRLLLRRITVPNDKSSDNVTALIAA
jgi:transposase